MMRKWEYINYVANLIIDNRKDIPAEAKKKIENIEVLTFILDRETNKHYSFNTEEWIDDYDKITTIDVENQPLTEIIDDILNIAGSSEYCSACHYHSQCSECKLYPAFCSSHPKFASVWSMIINILYDL